MKIAVIGFLFLASLGLAVYTGRRAKGILDLIGTVPTEKYYQLRDERGFDKWVALNALTVVSTLAYLAVLLGAL